MDSSLLLTLLHCTTSGVLQPCNLKINTLHAILSNHIKNITLNLPMYSSKVLYTTINFKIPSLFALSLCYFCAMFFSGAKRLSVAKYTLTIMFSIGCCETGPSQWDPRIFLLHKVLFFCSVYFTCLKEWIFCIFIDQLLATPSLRLYFISSNKITEIL